MGIEPKVEEPTRDLLGHAIRGEWDAGRYRRAVAELPPLVG
jgi:hypothetical protein